MRVSMCNLRRATAALALVMSMLMVGCSGRLQNERNALWAQNQELQEELNRSRAALDAQMAADAARQAEMERLRQQQLAAQQAAARQTAPAAPAGGAENFGGIEGVSARMEGRNIQVTVASDILFAPGKADLSATARTTLSRVATVLRSEHPNNRIVVEGHTDTDPIRKSKWASNQALSEARAQAVANHLAQQGVSRARMQIVGHGSTQPLESKAKSRRVEIVVVQ